jgi:hypothetical protein
MTKTHISDMQFEAARFSLGFSGMGDLLEYFAFFRIYAE